MDRKSLQERTGELRRKVGCIWGCLTEPVVLLGLTALGLLFGHAWLVRRATKRREREAASREAHRDD